MPVAQFNLGYLKYARDAPEMSSYIEQLDKVMKIAVSNPGLIWLHEDNTINEVYRVFGRKDNPAANLSIWTSVDCLRRFMISEMHSAVMNRRDEWFKTCADETFVMWYISKDYRPTIKEAYDRLKYLNTYGQTEFAFNDLIKYPEEPKV